MIDRLLKTTNPGGGPLEDPNLAGKLSKHVTDKSHGFGGVAGALQLARIRVLFLPNNFFLLLYEVKFTPPLF